jgi:DNA-directed RNA polymerase specialized sigma24 family protein
MDTYQQIADKCEVSLGMVHKIIQNKKEPIYLCVAVKTNPIIMK